MAYKYKIDVIDALARRGFNSYVIKQRELLSQGTLTKLRSQGNVTIETLNTICCMLRCQISDIVEIEPTAEEKIKYY